MAFYIHIIFRFLLELTFEAASLFGLLKMKNYCGVKDDS